MNLAKIISITEKLVAVQDALSALTGIVTTLAGEVHEAKAALETESAGATSTDGPAEAPAQQDESLPPITLADLKDYLNEQVREYGKPAQDHIKEIILARGGTQALSQVPERAYATIRRDVAQWVAEQSADADDASGDGWE